MQHGIDGWDGVGAEFWTYAQNLGFGELVYFEISYTGVSGPWYTVESWGNHFWTFQSFDLSAFSSGASDNEPNFAIRFRSNGNAADEGLLVDSRKAERYSGESEPIDPVASHIPGAINIPFPGNISSSGRWKEKGQLADRFKSLDSRNPVFYCGSGVTACHNILAYESAGFGEARLYPGSWSEWIANGKNPIATT